MSRSYAMDVTVTGYLSEQADSIKKSLADEWPFDDFYCYSEDRETPAVLKMIASGNGNLCGGEGDEEFAERVSEAVWKANGAYCSISVRATFLEDLPYEEHIFDENDYKIFESGAADDGH